MYLLIFPVIHFTLANELKRDQNGFKRDISKWLQEKDREVSEKQYQIFRVKIIIWYTKNLHKMRTKDQRKKYYIT